MQLPKMVSSMFLHRTIHGCANYVVPNRALSSLLLQQAVSPLFIEARAHSPVPSPPQEGQIANGHLIENLPWPSWLM